VTDENKQAELKVLFEGLRMVGAGDEISKLVIDQAIINEIALIIRDRLAVLVKL
jgi:hypothetical protein